MFAVVAAFVTIGVTAWIARGQADLDRSTAQQQAALTERGQVTDRFSKAVDQLGIDQLNVRLGGIYAMERIARDSSDDRQAIDEILTAFIRQTAPPKRSDATLLWTVKRVMGGLRAVGRAGGRCSA